MLQKGRPVTLDTAVLSDGDITDTLGRVLFRATIHGWLWVAL